MKLPIACTSPIDLSTRYVLGLSLHCGFPTRLSNRLISVKSSSAYGFPGVVVRASASWMVTAMEFSNSSLDIDATALGMEEDLTEFSDSRFGKGDGLGRPCTCFLWTLFALGSFGVGVIGIAGRRIGFLEAGYS